MSAAGLPSATLRELDRLYLRFNARAWVHPDPLEFLYNYPDAGDREIAALIASSLAYGRVAQILKSVSLVLETLGSSPRVFLRDTSPHELRRIFKDFRHRFTTGAELADLLIGVRQVIGRHGSLYASFLAGFRPDDATTLPGLVSWVDALTAPFAGERNSLLPSPRRGSACKRLHLFLRWMVRSDEVDPGGWHGVEPSQLVVPLDTHMHRICRLMNLTERKSASMQTAVEITQAFRTVAPHDPVRYDFCLTRLGIRDDCDMAGFLDQCGVTDAIFQGERA